MIGELTRWHGRLTVQSPLSHHDEISLSTETKFRRMAYSLSGRKVDVPVYTGNAFRGRLRRLAARHYLDAIGITACSPKLHYLFYAGGALEKRSTQTVDPVGARRDLRRLIPPLSLFGTAVGNYMVGGRLNVGIALPVCRELAPYTGIAADRSLWDCLGDVFYTRRDDLEDKPADGPVQQMKYQVEVLVPGTELSHTFALRDADAVLAGCFGHLMRLFEADPVLGGLAAKGHGAVTLAYTPAWPDPAPYLDFLEAHREACVAYVRQMEMALG